MSKLHDLVRRCGHAVVPSYQSAAIRSRAKDRVIVIPTSCQLAPPALPLAFVSSLGRYTRIHCLRVKPCISTSTVLSLALPITLFS